MGSNLNLGTDALINMHNFFDLKNSGQDLFYEGSNFILSLLEVAHWVAQT